MNISTRKRCRMASEKAEKLSNAKKAKDNVFKTVLSNARSPKTDSELKPRPIAAQPTKLALANFTAFKINNNLIVKGSIYAGKEVLNWLINPFNVNDFIATKFEQRVILPHRKSPKYYSELISLDEIEKILQKNTLEYQKNVIVTNCVNGKTNRNDYLTGRAIPHQIWELYEKGFTICLNNLEHFSANMHVLCSHLQEFFYATIETCTILSTPNSQGFAARYDESESFIMQIDGRSQWQIWSPRNNSEILPLFKSQDINDEDLPKPILETILESGDMIYLPRGYIYKSKTGQGTHSLQVKLNVYKNNSFFDLFETLQSKMSSLATIKASRALQMDPSVPQSKIVKNIRKILLETIDEIEDNEIDNAVDQMAIRFQRNALRPNLISDELGNSAFGIKTKIDQNGNIKPWTLTDKTLFRLIRGNILRLIQKDGNLLIYSYLNNEPMKPNRVEDAFEVNESASVVIDYLLKVYPVYVTLNELPVNVSEAYDAISDLWKRGLLLIENVID